MCVCVCVGNVNRQRFIAFSATSLHFLASENGSGAGMPRRMLLKLFVICKHIILHLYIYIMPIYS